MYFIVQAKKQFAPYLKSVIGPWVCGMNDPYVPAATAAREAFHSAFSEPKRIEVFKYAFHEIILVSAAVMHPQSIHIKWRNATFLYNISSHLFILAYTGITY